MTIRALLAAVAMLAAFVCTPALAQDTAAPLAVALQDGIISLRLASGWESNSRLAKDNDVPLFLHPSGMEQGARLPAWMLVDRRPFQRGDTAASAVARILREGGGFGFVVRDSIGITLPDGRLLRVFRFRTGADGEERGMALLETTGAFAVFRYAATDSASWDRAWPAVEGMLKSASLALRDRP